MTKLQRIDNLIATLESQLEEIYNQMEKTDDQDEIFNLDDLTTEIIRKLAKLEVSRHEARIVQHYNAGRYDNDEGDFIS